MKNRFKKTYPKILYVLVSLFLIGMTIALTVWQSTKRQTYESSAASEIVQCNISGNAIINDDEEKKARNLINDFRKSQGLTELAFQEDLNRAAAWQSKDMADRNKLDHSDSTGRTSLARIEDCGYKPFAAARENIGEGQKDAQAIFKAWKNSSSHKDNMLCPECTQIGLAREQKKNKDTWFWTMTVGTLLSQQGNSPTALPSVPSGQTTTTPTSPPTEITDTPTDDDLPPSQTTLPAGTTGVSLRVIFPSVFDSGNTAPKHPTRPITVIIVKPNNKEVAEVKGTVTFRDSDLLFTGMVALPDTLPNGTYRIKLKSKRTLIKNASSGYIEIEKGSKIDLETTVLPDVDLNENNSISYADIIYFRNCLRRNDCPSEYTDLNDDGVSDIFDYNAFLSAFSSLSGQ